MYLGQVNRSTDNKIKGRAKEMYIGLTPIFIRELTKIINEKKSNIRFNTKKAICHSFPKKTFSNPINETGTEKK